LQTVFFIRGNFQGNKGGGPEELSKGENNFTSKTTNKGDFVLYELLNLFRIEF